MAAAVLTAPLLPAQAPSAPPGFPPAARDVREEQRHIADYLTYAASDNHKGLERAGANNLDLATVSGLHAVDQLLQCSKLMDQDPQHVEQIRSWFFDNDVVRTHLRNNFFLFLKPRYDDLEERLDEFAHALKQRGYSAVLVTINKLRAWNTANDPEAKRQIEHEIDQVVTEVSRSASARAGGGSDASTGLQAGGGADEIGSRAGAVPQGPGGPGATGVSLGNGITASSGPGGVTLTDPSGRSATLPGAFLNP